jgi:hypothetical protein
MALRVPVAERRVTAEPLPGARLDVRGTRGAFGSQEAQAITELGRVVGKVGAQVEEREAKIELARKKEAADLQERKDKMYANSAKLEYQQKYADNSNQFLAPARLNADGVSQKYKEWHAKAQDDILSRATTEREKQLIRAGLDTEFTKNYIKTVDHENKQLQLAETELNDSIFTNAVKSVGLADSNEIDILDGELVARKSLDEKVKGMDAQTAKKVKAEGMSEFHESVVEGKLVSNLEFARSYFNETKADINPKEREALRKAIREATVTQTAQNIADKISATQDDRLTWDSHVPLMTKDKEIQDAAKEILSAKKKDADAHEDELVKRDYLEGLDNVLNAKNLEDGVMKANLIENPENRLKAIKVANSLHERKKRDIETKIPVYADVIDRINQGEFDTATELLEFYPDLSNADYQKLVNELDSYQKEQKTGKKAEGKVISHSDAKKAFEGALNVKYSVEEYGESFSAILRVLESEGRELSVGQAEDVIRQHLINNRELTGVVAGSGWVWDDKLTYEEALRSNKLEKFLPNLVEDDDGDEQEDIRSAFIAQGYRDDIPEMLMRLYKKRYINKLPMSSDEMAAFDSELSKLRKQGDEDTKALKGLSQKKREGILSQLEREKERELRRAK